MIRRDRLAALAALAIAKKDADLARLAGVTARLAAAACARDDLEASLLREMAKAMSEPEVPVLQALDVHVLMAEQARGALEASISRIAGERDDLRRRCALSFGRAEVLGKLCEQTRRRAKAPD